MKKFRRISFLLLPTLAFFIALFAFSAPAHAGTGGVTDADNFTAEFLDTNYGSINFKCTNCDIEITDSGISGYAWGDVVGWINFNPSQSGVINTVSGELSGYAWGDVVGWINFNPSQGGVTIDPGNGDMNGYAWAQNYGWLEFDCSAGGKVAGQCVNTDWRPGGTSGGGCTVGIDCNDLCPNITGDDKGKLTEGYLPPLFPGEDCIEILNQFPKVKIDYPLKDPLRAIFLSADASAEEQAATVPPLPLADFDIKATATDADGIIMRVEFFEKEGLDGTDVSLGFDTTLPYSIHWTKSVLPGEVKEFYLKVSAIDDYDHVSEDTVKVTVGRLPDDPEPTECSDGKDNDVDGFADFSPPAGFQADPDCSGPDDDNETGDFCTLHPSDDKCTDFCEVNPEAEECQEDFCIANPDNIKCFCEANPDDSDCQADFCTANPTAPECNPDFCTENPTNPSCKVDPCVKDQNSFACLISKRPPPPIELFLPEIREEVALGLRIAATASAVIGGILALATALFLNPLALPEMILIPFRLWSLLLTALGIKKRVKPWGTVYDAITKQPLDPVYVSLRNLEGTEIASSITDIDGRYGFLVEPGVYKVIPKKTNYLFPSDALSSHFRDEFYQDLYFGDYMNIGPGEVIVKNIPMDPVNFDWNEFAKNKKQLFRFYSKRELWLARISNWLFNFGFAVAAAALIISPEKYNMVIFSFYVGMFILRRTSFKLKAKGRVLEADGSALSFAFVRVFSSETNVEIAHKVTDQMGRYYMLVPNGMYYVKIERKNDDGSYSLVHTSNYFKIMHGVLNRVFNIQ